MAKIVVTGAGSAQSNGVINCLLKDSGEEVIGIGSDISELVLCNAHKKVLVPHSRDPKYKETLLRFLSTEKPDMLHFQHDLELSIALQFKDEILKTGVKMYVPDNETVDICVHKYKSWQKFRAYGVKVPENIIIKDEDDLRRALKELGNKDGKIWLRSMSIGGGGKGALPVNDFEIAREWIEENKGWGDFVAAELLSKDSVTLLSIWHEGEFIVGQTRKRNGWAHSSLSPSGVTGVTKVGETCSSSLVDDVGLKAVRAVSVKPHGVYGVDMTYDFDGVPNPTEINIGRFFTTVQFFAEAGLNMPKILKDICIYGKFPKLEKTLNPLPDGLLWLRAMDCLPRLMTKDEVESSITRL